MYRILDHGDLGRRHRAHVTFQGSPAAAAELARDLREGTPDTQVDALHQASDQGVLLLDAPLEGPGGGLASLAPTLQQHRLPAVIDPIVASEGRLHVRIVVPRQADAQEVLRGLQALQRGAGFSELRVTRIAPVSPAAHVESARRVLAPEQEALLALATSMGYYSTPKGVTLEQIARTVGLSISPVHKRLKAAEEAIVSAHVAQEPAPEARRRARRAPPLEATYPSEIQLRVRADFGPTKLLAQVPEARASLHALSADGGRSHASLLILLAPEDTQAKLLSGIEDAPEVASVAIIERTPRHVACRLTTRERGAYSLSWWSEAWGSDAALRCALFEGGVAHVRALLTRPWTPERLEARLREAARLGGWDEWDVECVRSLATAGVPPMWPEPLTQRQLEVMRVAHALGYYRTPRESTLEHVASTLGVSANAVHKNLVLGESKLITAYLASGL